jgi:hypothetical protein
LLAPAMLVSDRRFQAYDDGGLRADLAPARTGFQHRV